MSTNTKRGFRMPNNYVVVFCIIVVGIALLQQKLTHSKEVQQ